MSFSYAEKRAAIRRAIAMVEAWAKACKASPSETEDLIMRLRSIESDYLQLRLPWDATRPAPAAEGTE